MKIVLLSIAALFYVSSNGQSFARADSVFQQKDYRNASLLYRQLLTGKPNDPMHLNRLGFSEYQMGNYKAAEADWQQAIQQNPTIGLKGSILSRLARVSSLHGDKRAALDYLDSAANNGYVSYTEMDTLKDFEVLRKDARFSAIRNRVFNTLYPCMSDPQAREFDFWVGEWDVYVTGTNAYAGHSLIQRISGGCALLENWNSSASEGKSLNFIDDSTKKWKQVWVGSYSAGKQDFTDGVYKDGAMRFRFETVDATGNKILGRFTFFNQGLNQVRQFNEVSSDGGKSWTVGYDFTYKRKINSN